MNGVKNKNYHTIILNCLPESIGHLQGDSVLQLLVQTAVLVFKQGVQGASQSQLHHQDLRSQTGCQKTHQAGVTEATQHHQLLQRNGKWKVKQRRWQ